MAAERDAGDGRAESLWLAITRVEARATAAEARATAAEARATAAEARATAAEAQAQAQAPQLRCQLVAAEAPAIQLGCVACELHALCGQCAWGWVCVALQAVCAPAGGRARVVVYTAH